MTTVGVRSSSDEMFSLSPSLPIVVVDELPPPPPPPPPAAATATAPSLAELLTTAVALLLEEEAGWGVGVCCVDPELVMVGEVVLKTTKKQII